MTPENSGKSEGSQERYRRIQERLSQWAGLRAVPASERDDLVQEAIQALVEYEDTNTDPAGGMDEAAALRYAYGVLRNRRALFIRRRILEERSRRRISAEGREVDAGEPGSPIEMLAQAERVRRAEEAVSKLAEDDRRLLYLRGQGWSFREVGDALGISEAAARQRYVRALGKVRAVYFGDATTGGDG